MPKMNVALSLDAKELKRFDDWRSSTDPPRGRGQALVWLLDFYEANDPAINRRVVEADDAPY